MIMRTATIFNKYQLTENGEVININTGLNLKVEETANGKFANLYIDGKSKRINILPLIAENFPQIEETSDNMGDCLGFNQTEETQTETQNEVQTEETQNEVQNQETTKRRESKKYIIRVTQLDGKVLEFKTFKEANDHYGLRKDYLNYCIAEKFASMLTRDGLQLKSVEKISR